MSLAVISYGDGGGTVITSTGYGVSRRRLLSVAVDSWLMDAARRSRRGPKPKDPTRVQTTVLLPAAVRARAQEIADQDGLALTNIIARELAKAFGLPVPEYCLPKRQEPLPLSKAS